MKVIVNPETKYAKKILDALKENDNYCPCSRIKSPDTKCICKDFRNKIDDINFLGYCHCGLYKKIEV